MNTANTYSYSLYSTCISQGIPELVRLYLSYKCNTTFDAVLTLRRLLLVFGVVLAGFKGKEMVALKYKPTVEVLRTVGLMVVVLYATLVIE